MNTWEYLTIAVAIAPERDAIVFEGRRITFLELQRRVNRLANALGELGLRPGDRVALMDVNTPELIESYLASAQLDAVFVPLNYRARSAELAQMLAACSPAVLLVGSRYRELVRDALAHAPSPRHLVALEEPAPSKDWLYYDDLLAGASDEELRFPAAAETDTTLLLFTSGTTGAPKAVMLNHNSFSSYMLSAVTPADPDVEERNLLSVPLYHVAGMQAALAGIYAGRTLVLARQFHAEEWMRLAQDERADRAGLVPTMLQQVLDHPRFADYDLSGLRIITYGAAPMPPQVIRRAIRALPNARFINAFGQTETASTITMLGPGDHVLDGDEAQVAKKLKRLSSVGRPLDDVEVSILDETGAPVATGVVGEVAARGPRLMTGYWRDDDATRNAFHGDWLLTGDLGYLDEDGYLFISGRSKDFIKRGGEMISPQEVEDALTTHPAVAEAAVIGVADLRWGERVRAVVVLKDGAAASESRLIEHCRRLLAGFKRPESVVFLEEIPRNPMGKVLKRVLRERYGHPMDDAPGGGPPNPPRRRPN